MKARDQPRLDWTIALRRPVCMVDGRPEGGWTGEFEIVCSECGDDPDLDYREVIPGAADQRALSDRGRHHGLRTARPAASRLAGLSAGA